MSAALRAAGAALVLLAAAAPAWSQQPALDPRRGQATRQDLQALLDLYEKSAASPAYSEGLRTRSQFEASLIRERLELGDFQLGDRILMTVEEEPALTDTFVVMEGPALHLPKVGEISLSGVLRSELEAHLRAQLSKSVLDPQVLARSHVRISIMGAVGRPGFYPAPAEALVTDALMLAGGTAPSARVDDITIEREGRRIWSGDQVRDAIVDGRTLDQLGLRAGDRIVVPQRRGWLGGAQSVFQVTTLISSLLFTVLTITRVF